MKDLRLISFCNTLYKAIFKILIGRLIPLLYKLISPAQISFVLDHFITDNAIHVQELLNKFCHMKGRKGFMAWKIDLSIAYNRMSWEFFNEVLKEVGFKGTFPRTHCPVRDDDFVQTSDQWWIDNDHQAKLWPMTRWSFVALIICAWNGKIIPKYWGQGEKESMEGN